MPSKLGLGTACVRHRRDAGCVNPTT
jgi:hypothetical protein